MIEGLKPYAEYKESGQEWLCDVPLHWDVRRTKLLLREVDSRSHTGKEQLLRVSQYSGITQRKAADRSDTQDTRAASLVGYKRVALNDLVINIMLAWNGSLGISRYDGIVSPAYCVYRFNKDALPWYFHKLFRLPLYKGRIKAASTGVVESRLRLYSDDLGRIEALFPPPDEQAAIVRFLDHANRKIDRFIRTKRKLIGLLNEQKQAIIQNAVTRGLNPDAPLKPSGIPWLGDIPAHWKQTRLKFEASHLVDCLHATPRYINDGIYPAIRTADIEPGKVRLEQARRISATEFKEWTARLKPEVGDILYSREGERFGIAATVPVDATLCISQRMMVFRIRKRQDSEYLMWQLNCQHVYLQASCDVIGSTAPHVNVEQIKNFRLAMPPLDEQKAIVDHLGRECLFINTAIARTEREISLMQEYRTRLTADMVTGKLDVREAAAKLPDLPANADHSPDIDPQDEGLFEETEPLAE
jgi:type I restriction enzyme S subunit